MDENPYRSPEFPGTPTPSERRRGHPAIEAGLLAGSMIGGAILAGFFCVNPLATARDVEFHAFCIIVGAVIGGVIWKLYRGL